MSLTRLKLQTEKVFYGRHGVLSTTKEQLFSLRKLLCNCEVERLLHVQGDAGNPG
jgi:hypothetical protein